MGVRSVDGVYWSLFVELKFYLLVVVLIYFKKIPHVEWYLLGWLIVSALLLIKPMPYLYALFIPQYAPYFVSGALFYLVYRDGWIERYFLLLVVSFVMSLFVSWRECEQLSQYYAGVSYNNYVAVGVTALFFVVLALVVNGITRNMVRPYFLLLGALTYPLYLVHQNIGYVLLNRISIEYYGIHVLFVLVIFMLLLSWVLHVFVERRYSKSLRAWLEKLFIRLGAPA
jgi:peptidoglycan/LPS O-acetylase OafA/YrhL